VKRQTYLLEVVLATRAARRLAGSLHGGQKERDEHSNDGDHHQEFHQRKTKTERAKMLGHEGKSCGDGDRNKTSLFASNMPKLSKRIQAGFQACFCLRP
jgi:hypothetical protein